jgi:Asp-tRNA(Asn)/Glu-tRNA(Gln) amidotransferase A subunit family amidase
VIPSAEALLLPLAERAGAFDAAELAAARDEHIRRHDPEYRAFAEWRPTPRPRSSVAVTYKDVVDVAGWATRCGSRNGFRYYPTRSAAVVSCLEPATVLCGKAETTEFGLGNWTACVNPRYPDYSPGGASSGTAVAVAAGFCDVGIGTDTAGSIRIPAGYCGVVGLRLTPDDRLLDGVVPVSPSMDAVGVVTRSAADLGFAWRGETLASLRSLLAREAREAQVPQTPVDLRIGCATNWLDGRCDPEILHAWSAFEARLSESKAKPKQVEMPWWRFREAAWSLLLREAADTHERLADRPGIAYSKSLEGVLASGRAVSPTLYAAAQADRRQARTEAAQTFRDTGVDVLFLPLDSTLPRHVSTPFPSRSVPVDGGETAYDPLGFCIVAGFAGLPALAMTWQEASSGAPIGIQALARRGHEDSLVAAAELVERLRAASPSEHSLVTAGS